MGDYTAQTRKHRRTHTQTSAIGLVTKPLGLTCFFRRQENCTAQIHVRTHKQRQMPVIKPSALTLLLQAPGKLHGSNTRVHTQTTAKACHQTVGTHLASSGARKTARLKYTCAHTNNGKSLSSNRRHSPCFFRRQVNCTAQVHARAHTNNGKSLSSNRRHSPCFFRRQVNCTAQVHTRTRKQVQMAWSLNRRHSPCFFRRQVNCTAQVHTRTVQTTLSVSKQAS